MSIDPLMESVSEKEKDDEHPSGISRWTSQHQRHPNSRTFHQSADDSTQHLEEKARKAALKLQQNVYKTKGTHENIKHTFFEQDLGNYTCTPVVNEGKREFRVDSGASVPFVGKNHLTPEEEAHTFPAQKTLCETLTAHGTVFTCGEATVHFEDLDMFVTVQLLEDTSRPLFGTIVCGEWTHI